MTGPAALPPPLPAAVAAGGGAGSGAALEVALGRLPERLQKLTRPVLLSGTLLGLGPDGTAQVRTQAGVVSLKPDPALTLPADGPVSLRLPAGNPPTRATVLLPLPPAGAGAASNYSPPSTQASPAALTSPPSVPPSGAAAPAAAWPAPGTLVPALVLGRTAPTASSVPTPEVLPEAVALPPGSRLVLQLVSASPPGQPALLPPAEDGASSEPPGTGEPAAAGLISGTVAGATAGGDTVIATPRGLLALGLRTLLPPGTRISATVADPAALRPAAAGPGSLPPSLPGALAEVLRQLEALAPALARTLAETVLPRPDRRLGAALAFFLDQARHGDARQWLGEAAGQTLAEAGHHELLERLEHSFDQPAPPAASTAADGWQALTVPLADGATILPLQFAWRRLEGDEADSGGTTAAEGGRRFLVDLSLSRLGPLQLDGLVYQRRFNLILRSRQPLPDDLRHELRQAFGQSLEVVGYQGGLSFQTGERGWPTPGRPAATPAWLGPGGVLT